MAGGAQLKKLKESLRNAGLTGQSNFSKKGKKGKKRNGAQDKLRKDDKEKILSEIREQFNPFDVKVSKNKRADALEKKITVGKPGISKQIGEENRRKEFEARMEKKGKAGGIIDRRFGEGNIKLTAEEKMLERFTRERLAKSNKSSMYNLDDDNNIDDDFNDETTGLTHLGQSLSNSKPTGNAIEDDDDDGFFSKKKRDADEIDSDQPLRKKTKAEVMKEVIAKSKKYKHERQQAHMENMEMVQDLDDNFENVMDEISTVNNTKTDSAKSKFDLEYDMKVTEAKLDRRAAPTDRTKTAEEIKKEEDERLSELEKKRQQRMEGEIEDEENGVTTTTATGDDLDDDFWAGSGDEETGFSVGSPAASYASDEDDEDKEEVSESETEEESNNNHNDKPKETIITIGNKKIVVKPKIKTAKLICPKNLIEFKKIINNLDHEEIVEITKKIFETYQPKLADGNKEKLGIFTTVLFEYLIEVSNKPFGKENKGYVRLMEFLTRTICNLTEKYQTLLLESFREYISNTHERIVSGDEKIFPLKSDIIMLTLIGRTFSTSDKYHLVVISAILVSCESLELMKPEDDKTRMFFGIFLCDLLLRYESISKRYIPEVVSFIHKILLALIPEPEKIQDWQNILICSTEPVSTKITLSSKDLEKLSVEENKANDQPISIDEIWKLSKDPKKTKQFLIQMLSKVLDTLDDLLTNMIKPTLAAPELTESFIVILKHYIKYSNDKPSPKLINLITKFSNINRLSIKERRPLKLQSHRAIGIATVAPRFNENYNPDRKSQRTSNMDPLDPIAVQDEINKLKHQVKEERKQALKDIRRDTKFEARAQISQKKKEYKEYHSKMSKIYNSIQTEEGTAKNEYEREKKALKNRK